MLQTVFAPTAFTWNDGTGDDTPCFRVQRRRTHLPIELIYRYLQSNYGNKGTLKGSKVQIKLPSQVFLRLLCHSLSYFCSVLPSPTCSTHAPSRVLGEQSVIWYGFPAISFTKYNGSTGTLPNPTHTNDTSSNFIIVPLWHCLMSKQRQVVDVLHLQTCKFTNTFCGIWISTGHGDRCSQ